MFGKRILILVPHPDDEVVACAATIGRAQQVGSKLFALYLTHGCIARDVMWPWQRKNYESIVARRRGEAEAVARFLDIEPVGWCARPARNLWRQMDAVYAEIQKAIGEHDIDQIWLPAYEGGNPDHDALNAVGQRLKRNASVLEFTEYNFFEGKAQSHMFPYPNGGERVIELTETECKAKKAALARYRSEKSNLNYVAVTRECFRPLADYDYTKPPYPGTLWYARFQWVPFRHPRVDFTNSLDVSKAIGEFLKSHS